MDASFSPWPEKPVLVIGAAGIDMVGRLRGSLHLRTSNPARIRSSYGGVARNIAENLARLGHPVRLLTVVGQDESGDRLLQQAAEAGVDVDSVLRHPDRPTGAYLAAIDADGALTVALDDMRALSALTPQVLDDYSALFEDAAFVFVDLNLPGRALAHTFALARRAGVPIGADPTSAILARRLRPHLRKLSLVVPNMAEAAILCRPDIARQPPPPSTGLEAAKGLVSLGVGLAVITLAEAGVSYATSQTSGQVPAVRTQVVDPTGGGDALTAAIIFGMLNGIPLDDAVRLGVSAAALTLSYIGAVVPDLSLEKLYDTLVI